jgi:hypothetical protein
MNSRACLRFAGFFVVAALLLISQPVWAEKRVALVLGNSTYQNVAPLANPVNDSVKIAATLKDAGFDVVDSRRDLAAAETRHALRDFADRARDADIAVVYYAGHGIELKRRQALKARTTPEQLASAYKEMNIRIDGGVERGRVNLPTAHGKLSRCNPAPLEIGK